MTSRMRMLPRLLAVALAATLAVPAAAQQWPTRALRIVTGTPAGGSPDFVSRLLAERLSERLGQGVEVENSATTGVATWNTVAKSQPDGYLVSMLTGAFFRACGSRQGAALSSDQGFRLHHTDLRLSDGGCDRSEFAAQVLSRSHRPCQGRAIRRDLRDEPARQRAPPDRRADQCRSRHFAARHSLPGQYPDRAGPVGRTARRHD